ncbi:hypothetical protein RD1_1410 [Roseobacter denitrificans OCh 114]|uniref:Uncharacterized protein n=1 Tax=Roseobacter denitrificans (strain ATCC 33942 / OCh 114) TaxID=375451 RepID=Q16AE3_ROSDO|nr:hypothetical protein RD1_1410 [Roseobacter denitrificans OCh 114]
MPLRSGRGGSGTHQRCVEIIPILDGIAHAGDAPCVSIKSENGKTRVGILRHDIPAEEARFMGGSDRMGVFECRFDTVADDVRHAVFLVIGPHGAKHLMDLLWRGQKTLPCECLNLLGQDDAGQKGIKFVFQQSGAGTLQQKFGDFPRGAKGLLHSGF